MDLQKLSKEAFETAKAHDWHDEELRDETYLMLIITEIAEAVQADREDRHADAGLFNADVETLDMTDDYDRDVWKRDFEIYIKGTVEDELCDVIIRCLDLAALRGISMQYVDEFLASDVESISEPFPVVMYHLCEELCLYKETLCEKLNLVVAVLLVYCRQKDIDIDFFVDIKMRYNRLRPFKHGNKKY